jgi:osmotically-inducible protein OsmY
MDGPVSTGGGGENKIDNNDKTTVEDDTNCIGPLEVCKKATSNQETKPAAAGTDGCAKWARQQLEKKGVSISGNAWEWAGRLKSGLKYNMYTNGVDWNNIYSKMKSNEDLQRDVQNAIKWEPLLHAAEIGVTAIDGVVTLTGTVDSYAKKTEAEEAAKKVSGLKALVEKIEIKFSSTWKKDDTEIATEILNVLKSEWEIPNDDIIVKVENGWVRLDGEVQWNYQREAAKKVVKQLSGVLGVTNDIKLSAETHDAIEKKDIQDALTRNWSISEQDIDVKVLGNKVTLNGTVDSYYQRDEAGRIAWNAPGVISVDNELVVEFN